ncbi:hypothetical protein C8Q77DRAFT_1160892 [Trametes polyzona]|nr:hypothetical protein C8Q77DRAFT_1160892 [Trametes polyzona]
MVFNQNANLTRFQDNSIVLWDTATGHCYKFSVDQLRLFGCFDDTLRNNHIYGPSQIIPASYNQFGSLWAQDPLCLICFSKYSSDSGIITIEGKALPLDDLAPGTPRNLQMGPTPSSAARVDGGYTLRQQAIVEDLIWSQLECNQHQQEFHRMRREARCHAWDDEAALTAKGSSRRAHLGPTAGKRLLKKKKHVDLALTDPEPSNVNRGRRDDDDNDMEDQVLRFSDQAGSTAVHAQEAKAVAAEAGHVVGN